MVPSDISARFRDEVPIETLENVARKARELWVWYREFVSTHAGKMLPLAVFDELESLNRLLAQDGTYRQMQLSDLSYHDRTGSRYALRWRIERRWRIAEDLLFPIAEAMVDVDTGKAVLRDYINATIGFEELSLVFGKSSKSLMRMFGPKGNPPGE